MSIVVATFGSPIWARMAARIALPSAMAEGVEVIAHHGPSLAEARNVAASHATGEWLVFLDADDRIRPGYCRSILDGSGDLRVPPLLEISGGVLKRVPLEERDIEQSNPCHVGTGIRRAMFEDLGGFPDLPVWEDWGLFLHAARRGATIEHLPVDGPAYLASVRPLSMNRRPFNRQAAHDRVTAWA